MGYLFALLSVLAGAAKGYCGKRTSGIVAGFSGAMLANFVRMCLCIVIGFLLLAVQGQLGLLRVDPRALGIMFASGITTAAFVVSWLVAVKKSAYMLLDVFLLLGTLVPMLLCRWLYDEPISLAQWIGLGILFLSAIIMCSYNIRLKGKLTLSGLGLLLFCGLSSGLADFCQKSYVKLTPQNNAAVFNFYTYVTAGVVLAICWLLSRKKARDNSGSTVRTLVPILGYVSVMALCLFANSYCKLIASRYLTATQLFPLLQGTGIAASTLMAAIFFKEKITPRCVLGLLLAFAGLLVMNLL